MMKRIVLLLLFVLVVAAPSLVASDGPTIENLDISLWPEYDRSELLVIYRGQLAPDTVLPAPVEFRIPARVGQPTAVAYVGSDALRMTQEHTTRQDGEWLVVAFELQELGFQLEYYDPIAVDADGNRAFTFNFEADYPITTFTLEAQVPPTAQAYTLEPAADSVVQEGDGLTYHLINAGGLEQGTERTWTFSYQKADPMHTVDILFPPETQDAQPAQPVAGAAQDGGNTQVLWFLGGFVALVAVGLGGFWLGRLTQPALTAPAPKRQKRRGSGRGSPVAPRPSSGGVRAPSGPGSAAFCHRCGTALRYDAEFCHSCGEDVRRT
jgi:hypothetical protein